MNETNKRSNLNPSENPRSSEAQIAAFWSAYREAIAADGLELQHADWYVKRAQQFVEKTHGSKLKEKSPEDVRAYLAQAAVYWSLKETFYIQWTEGSGLE